MSQPPGKEGFQGGRETQPSAGSLSEARAELGWAWLGPGSPHLGPAEIWGWMIPCGWICGALCPLLGICLVGHLQTLPNMGGGRGRDHPLPR